jgi:outer membrane biosynthesis protein TonB
VRGELDARDKQLGDTVAEIERLREDRHSLKGEIKDRGSAIVTLQTELEKVRGEVLERDVAIAKLESELAAGNKQLTLFPGQETTPIPTQISSPEPTPEPETIPTPKPTPEPKAKAKTKTKAKSKAAKKPQPEVLLLDSIDRTVAVGGLMEHLLDRKKQDPNFPDPPEKTQTFTDAVTGQTQRLSELERLYGFNLAGYVMKGKKREYRYTIN